MLQIKNITFLGEATSTNEVSKNMLKHRINDADFAIVANSQTNGYGKHGRAFTSKPGCGIYISIVHIGQVKDDQASLLSLAAGVACSDAIKDVFGIRTDLKWVNDLLLHGQKVGGILIEKIPLENNLIGTVVGVGINLCSNGQYSGILREDYVKNQGVVKDFVVTIVNRIYLAFQTYQSQYWINRYQKLDCLIGHRVKIILENQTYEGIVEEYNKNGFLSLRMGKNRLQFVAAEVIKVVY